MYIDVLCSSISCGMESKTAFFQSRYGFVPPKSSKDWDGLGIQVNELTWPWQVNDSQRCWCNPQMVPNMCMYYVSVYRIPYTLGLPSSNFWDFGRKIAPMLGGFPIFLPIPAGPLPSNETDRNQQRQQSEMPQKPGNLKGREVGKSQKKDGKIAKMWGFVCHDVGVYGYQMVSKPILVGLRYGIWWGVPWF